VSTIMILAIAKYFRTSMNRLIGVIGLLWAYPCMAVTVNTDNGQLPYEQCGYCHEYDGNSFAGNYPKIAGMKPRYLMKQLLDYKFNRRNGDGKMQEAAALLTDKDMQGVVSYFAAQKRTPEPAIRAGMDYSHARELATRGDPRRVIVACNACHDSNNPDFPKLEGQHAEYLAQELFAFKRHSRNNDDPSIMRYLAERLSDTEIRQLSEYLAAGGQAQ